MELVPRDGLTLMDVVWMWMFHGLCSLPSNSFRASGIKKFCLMLMHEFEP